MPTRMNKLAILRSINPIEIGETEEITVLGQKGIWSNKQEINLWKGDIHISEYIIHEDENPEIITKKVALMIARKKNISHYKFSDDL
jgi:hypothetical protein